MTVFCVYKHYGYDDRGFCWRVFSTRELAEQALVKIGTFDNEGDFSSYIIEETVFTTADVS